jgi:hypothetical protein
MAQALSLLLAFSESRRLTVSSRVLHVLKNVPTRETSFPSSHNGMTVSIILSTKFVKFHPIYENYGSNNGNERSGYEQSSRGSAEVNSLAATSK